MSRCRPRTVISDMQLREVLLAPSHEKLSEISQRTGVIRSRVQRLRAGAERCAVVMKDQLRREGLLP
jgi:hypothetical protein